MSWDDRAIHSGTGARRGVHPHRHRYRGRSAGLALGGGHPGGHCALAEGGCHQFARFPSRRGHAHRGGAAACVGVSLGAWRAVSTSAASTRPRGPVPATPASSTPLALACRRASGVAMTRAEVAAAIGVDRWRSSVLSLTSAAATGIGDGVVVGCAASSAPPAEPLSPSSVHLPISVPTGTVSPTGTGIPCRMPSAGASNSTAVLSLSTTNTVCPAMKRVPGWMLHSATAPSIIVSPSLGRTSRWSIDMSQRPLNCAGRFSRNARQPSCMSSLSNANAMRLCS